VPIWAAVARSPCPTSPIGGALPRTDPTPARVRTGRGRRILALATIDRTPDLRSGLDALTIRTRASPSRLPGSVTTAASLRPNGPTSHPARAIRGGNPSRDAISGVIGGGTTTTLREGIRSRAAHRPRRGRSHRVKRRRRRHAVDGTPLRRRTNLLRSPSCAGAARSNAACNSLTRPSVVDRGRAC
jgi:hypothetical protein